MEPTAEADALGIAWRSPPDRRLRGAVWFGVLMRALAASVALAAWATIALAPASVRAQSPALCNAAADDDELHPLPQSLVPQAVQLFGLHGMDAAQVRRGTVVRFMDGRLLACNYGANLPCGKANTSRSLRQGDAWCRRHPEVDFIPAYIAGHDSIYHWRCIHGAPVATGPAEAVDARGFIAKYWKPVP